MKRTGLLTIAGLAVFTLFAWGAPFLISTATAQSTQLTDEQRARIVSNCTTIKNSLNQLRASDALLRVNRGQAYESLSNRLMDTFNARLSSNGLDAKGMVSVTSTYDATLTGFRTAYQGYERQLVAAIRIDCTKDPDAFHAAIADARTKRTAVHDQVVKLHQAIDDYGTVVSDFYGDFRRVSEGV